MRVPDFTLPSSLSKLLTHLPATPPAFVLAAGLNQLVKRGILPADMSLLDGRRFEVRVQDAGISLRFSAVGQGFQVDRSTDEPDLRFTANAADFARMMLREEDPDTLFFNRKLIIEGDTELGLIVKNLLDSVDWSGTPVARFMAA
ncbi:ubiquinone anaerobic biosynthesis accessory factor UbiT [Paludibacterium purpuratum]|uniref:Ubiquinone biosynthesis accessory factor UbiT n=1 Tax=Paludibacterium purpuratum TaxID=1144873 RepID=A0A4R7B3W2_9NEIS|nr:SCP2 sterol-binding domain-containing protein [Paludibacterium purpuratum]TDR76675.1 putative lipid carrier protein YhbT [Paludibacterium purpuratum]